MRDDPIMCLHLSLGEGGGQLLISSLQTQNTRKWNEMAPGEVQGGGQEKALHPEHGLSLEMGGTGLQGRAHDTTPVQVQGASGQGF